MSEQTITINGTHYDVQTGLPVTSAAPVAAASRAVKPSQTAHSTVQKSHTLNRKLVQPAPAHQIIKKSSQPTARPDIARHHDIKKFAPHPAGAKPAIRPVVAPVATPQPQPVVHPVVARASVRQQRTQQIKQVAAQPAATPSAHLLKQAAIASALAEPAATQPHKELKASKRQSGRQLSIASAALALILLGGYFTYLNMPNLSVRIAAAQAGIAATYPSYHPDGYRLNGPVAYSDGSVNIKFASNSGPQSYTITQVKTNWDSSAVEQDINQKTSGGYSTSTTSGLTIYLYGDNAAWVNRGILYSLVGDAPLSSQQVDNIATSM